MLHEFRELMTELKGKDGRFDTLFERHNELDDKIKDAENGRIFLDEFEIANLKKEKLRVKDELNHYLSNYKK